MSARINRKRNAHPAKVQPKPAGLSPKPRQAHAGRIQKGAKLLNCNGLARDMSDPRPLLHAFLQQRTDSDHSPRVRNFMVSALDADVL